MTGTSLFFHGTLDPEVIAVEVSWKMKNSLGEWIKQNQSDWARLEHLIAQVPHRKLKKEELDELARLYRAVSSQYSFLQTYYSKHETATYLKNLVIQAHNLLYSGSKEHYLHKIKQFYFTTFPALLIQRIRPFALSAFILACGFLVAFFLTLQNQNYATLFFPEDFVKHVNPNEAGSVWDPLVASGEIMANNIQVAFFCFAYGALLGIGTVWMLFSNGLLIGALAALYFSKNGSYIFWAYILPHGVIELTAIFIAGAAGLSLAYRIFVPGEMPRIQAIIQEGRVTIRLILGVIPMFVVAAIIEGFITPAPWSLASKYFVALITLLLLVVYFGRKRENIPD
jgi:uncharacterized membrane protein SpoIIM required for sporulation